VRRDRPAARGRPEMSACDHSLVVTNRANPDVQRALAGGAGSTRSARPVRAGARRRGGRHRRAGAPLAR